MLFYESYFSDFVDLHTFHSYPRGLRIRLQVVQVVDWEVGGGRGEDGRELCGVERGDHLNKKPPTGKKNSATIWKKNNSINSIYNKNTHTLKSVYWWFL